MNYTNLFPELLKKIPTLPKNSFCYDSIEDSNYNKNQKNNNLRSFIPSGKRQILWFLKHGPNYYSVLLEYQNPKNIKCHFKYIAFDKILASGLGTMLWVTQIGSEISLNKIIYLKGKIFNLKRCKDHMEKLRYLIENYINNLTHSSFVQLKIPVIDDTNSVLSFVGDLDYQTYNVVSLVNNYNIHIKNFYALFSVSCSDSLSDCYKLYCKDKNGEIMFYQNALVNNLTCSRMLKKIFKIKHVQYENIEYSDDECDNAEIDINENSSLTNYYIYCLFDKNHKRWKPYKLCREKCEISNINRIKTLEDKSSRI